MPRQRGELNTVRKHRLEFSRDRAEEAQRLYRKECLEALEDGGSFSWVSEVTGLSTNTLQRWKREASE
jgi:DNA invertase Pin-like site-specific DNA recombinase